jgi:uroporphyrinogen decarboxylase
MTSPIPGTLMSPRTLDRLWLPHFARALEPMLKTDVRMIWHCDGNLMQMVPRLVDAGVRGFQGFQYEDGMDYERICAMKTRDGDPLVIIGGVSVTRTLPFGTPADVKRSLPGWSSADRRPGYSWAVRVHRFRDSLGKHRDTG